LTLDSSLDAKRETSFGTSVNGWAVPGIFHATLRLLGALQMHHGCGMPTAPQNATICHFYELPWKESTGKTDELAVSLKGGGGDYPDQ
jgi:hypothetical protein